MYTTDATGWLSNYSSYTSAGTASPWDYRTVGTAPTWEYNTTGTQTTTGITDYTNHRIIFSEHSTGDFYNDPERIVAEERARSLLLEHLDEFNKDRYIKKEPIEIPSNIWSDVRYRLPISKWEKIVALKKEKVIDRLCLMVQEPEYLPLEDVVLTKMLHVLYNEIEMLRTANHYPEKDGENLLNRLT